MERPAEITLAVEGTTTITNEEYRELIASQTMLDMILDSAKRDSSDVGYPDHSVVRAANTQRELYAMCCLCIEPEAVGGDGDA